MEFFTCTLKLEPFLSAEVIGLYQPNQNSMPYRGIAAAKGPCWCEEDLGVVCTCMPGHYQDIPDPPDDSPHDDSTINTSVEMHKQIYKTTTAKEQNDSNKAFAYIESGNVFAKPLIDTSSISTTQYNITEQGKVLGNDKHVHESIECQIITTEISCKIPTLQVRPSVT